MLSAAGVAAVLAVLVLVSNSLRADNVERQTRFALDKLRLALHSYHAVHNRWPNGNPAQALAALLDDPAPRSLMAPLLVRADEPGRLSVLDGFGHPIRYLPPAAPGAAPDFASAGADGILGDPRGADPALRRAAADDLYASELATTLPELNQP